MKIAITIPFYNEEQLIWKTLQSFKEIIKVFPGSFFVLVDNNSTDNSRKIIEDFKSKNKKIPVTIIVEKRAGVEITRKTALDTSYSLNPDIILSTDADTVFQKDYLNNFFNELISFNNSRFNIFIGEGTTNPNIYLMRMIYFGKFVEIKRRSWNLYFRLFGPYFFGSFSCIKRRFYGKIKDYFKPGTSPIKEEDLLLSKRAYYMNGKFYFTRTSYVITSYRRFINDPYQWIIGKRKGDFREIPINNLHDYFKRKRLEIENSFPKIEKDMITTAVQKIWLFVEDAHAFNKQTDFRYKRTTRAIRNVFQFFKMGELDERSDTKLLKKKYQKLAYDILNRYFFRKNLYGR